MGFLKKIFVNKTSEKIIYNPVRGTIIPLSKVEDPVFSSGMMGPGVGILPEEGAVYAPVDGEITVAFHTGHAVGLKTNDGMEVLIHIGIDTVKMNGDGFFIHVKEGEKVNSGDLLVSFDINKIISAGYQTTTMLVVSNAEEFGKISNEHYGNLGEKKPVFCIK